MWWLLAANGEALAAVLPALAAMLAAPSASHIQNKASHADTPAVQGPSDALAMQLDALRALLLILPVPQPQVPHSHVPSRRSLSYLFAAPKHACSL